MADSLLGRFAERLFGSAPKAADSPEERKLVEEVTDAVVDAVEPRVRMDARYRKKLEPCIRRSIAHLRAIGREGLEPIPLTRTAWATDPRVNAFFATADDIAACLGRSPALQSFFGKSGAQEAYALLGMKKEERSVLGMDLKGDTVQREVPQTLVSFSNHTIVAPAATLAETRLEAGRRIMLRLAEVALARIVATDAKATDLEQHKAYLGARLRLLRLAQDGMPGIVKDPATVKQEMQAVERELKETVEGFIEAKGSLATLDGYIGHIDDVFSHPDRHVGISQTPLRLSQMGVRVEGEASGPVNELRLAELAIGEGWKVAIAVVRCARSELPSKADLIAAAERSL